jgi:hypothetical protein
MIQLVELLESGNMIEVGAITVRQLKDGSFYIEKENEDETSSVKVKGVHVPKKDFESLIFDFYKENF